MSIFEIRKWLFPCEFMYLCRTDVLWSRSPHVSFPDTNTESQLSSSDLRKSSFPLLRITL